jgi:surface antigen
MRSIGGAGVLVLLAAVAIGAAVLVGTASGRPQRANDDVPTPTAPTDGGPPTSPGDGDPDTAALDVGVLPGNDPANGDTVLCSSAAYSCTGGGYGSSAAKKSGWPWSYYGYPWASSNSYGPHNCTLYAAYRLKLNGLGDPRWSDDAGKWYTHLSSSNVDNKPAIGSIAEWSARHVAYVESVSATGITLTDDNEGANLTSKQKIVWNTKHWPNRFLHIRDQGPRWPGDPRGNIVGWRNTNGSITSWYVKSDGKRYWIPTTTVYWCLRNKGAKDYGPQPSAILNLLPDSGQKATCS